MKNFLDQFTPVKPPIDHQESMEEFYLRKEREAAEREQALMDTQTSSVYERHLQTFIGIAVMGLVSWVAFEFNDLAINMARMDERTQSSNEIALSLKQTLDLYSETMVTKSEMVSTANAYKDQAAIAHDLIEEKIRAIEKRVTQLEHKVFNQ